MSKFGLDDNEYKNILEKFNAFIKKSIVPEPPPERSNLAPEGPVNETRVNKTPVNKGAETPVIGKPGGPELSAIGKPAEPQVSVNETRVNETPVIGKPGQPQASASEGSSEITSEIDTLFTFLKITTNERIKNKLNQILTILNPSAH